jgi:Na+/H+ antiporter NhaA
VGSICPPGAELSVTIEEVVMVTFVSTLIFGAVLGFMLEQQVGVPLVKWSRVKRMRMRILRRNGENPWSALLRDDEE